MQLTYAREQEDFRSALRGFLDQHWRETDVRRCLQTADGFDAELWRRLADEVEVQGLLVPEEHGGSGYGPRELVLVFEELGRALCGAPLLGTVGLAVPLLCAIEDDDLAPELLSGIATGRQVAAVALLGAAQRWDALGASVVAERGEGGYRLSGRSSLVVDAASADVLIIVVAAGTELSAFAVDAAAPGVTRQVLPTLDLTRRLTTIDLDSAPARLIGTEGGARQAVEHALELATLALAGEQVGGAQKMLDTAVTYAGERFQFGRAIGSFQAVKHRLADMLAAVELARSAAYHAGWVAESGTEDLHLAASLAAVTCGETYVRVAGDAIQVHGGIGVTWEHPAHFYFKRAKSSQLLLRDVAFHRARLATLI